MKAVEHGQILYILLTSAMCEREYASLHCVYCNILLCLCIICSISGRKKTLLLSCEVLLRCKRSITGYIYSAE